MFWDTASAGKQAFFVADPGDNRFVSAGMIGAVEPGSALLGAVVTNGAYPATAWTLRSAASPTPSPAP